MCASATAGEWTAFNTHHVKLSGLQKHNFHVFLQFYSLVETALFIVTVFVLIT